MCDCAEDYKNRVSNIIFLRNITKHVYLNMPTAKESHNREPERLFKESDFSKDNIGVEGSRKPLGGPCSVRYY